MMTIGKKRWIGLGSLFLMGALAVNAGASDTYPAPAEAHVADDGHGGGHGDSHADSGHGGGLGVHLEVGYFSKYIWRGFDEFDDHAAYHPKLEVDLFGSGFVVEVAGWDAASSGFVNHRELEYGVGYHGHAFDNEAYATHYALHYVYYDYPNIASDELSKQELTLALSWPELLSSSESAPAPFVNIHKLWPAKDHSDVAGGSGFLYTLGFTYDVAVPTSGSHDESQTLTFIADVNYNDGFGGHLDSHHHFHKTDHDWSHATLGVSSDIIIGTATITPSLNYQISMDDSVNEEDEFWGGVTVGFHF